MGAEVGNPFAFVLDYGATIQTKYAEYPELYTVPWYIWIAVNNSSPSNMNKATQWCLSTMKRLNIIEYSDEIQRLHTHKNINKNCSPHI